MIFFGHLGLTYALSKVIDKASSNKLDFDYRAVLVGSILPDLIDKPIIFLISNDTISSGRIFGHTLLFTLIIAAIGILLYKNNKSPLILTLAAFSFVHLIFDGMWNYLKTLFWPVYDLIVSKSFYHSIMSIFDQGFDNVTIYSLKNILSRPFYLFSELIGLFIVIHLVVRLIVNKKAGIFLNTGKIDK